MWTEQLGAGGNAITTPQLKRLAAHCQRLRPHRVGPEFATPLKNKVLTLDVRSKHEKHLAMRVSMARFPFQKTLEGFEWKFQPSIVRFIPTTTRNAPHLLSQLSFRSKPLYKSNALPSTVAT